MDMVQKIEISREDLICRIPALFAYIEWNEDGTVETHVATDSENGTYGKIADNISVPYGVRLTNYVDANENEIRDGYEWGEYNTIGLSENKLEYFSNSGAAYLRKVLWYFYTKINSTPEDAVFYDDIPNEITDEDPLYLKVPMKGADGDTISCDGVIVYEYYEKNGSYVYYKREDIIKPCTTYSYRTIINEYYKYRDIVGAENTFIKFVEKGLGKLYVDRELLNLEDEEKYSEVPEYIYLSQVRKLKATYDYYRTASEHYVYYSENGLKSNTLEEKYKKYTRMGGDNMTNWLSQVLQSSYDIANEYKCYADNKDFQVCVNTNVMLTKTEGILGVETVIENEFVPGNRYYDGDLLTYNGKTYICKLDSIEPNGENYQYIVKNREEGGNAKKTLFVLNGTEDGYTYIESTNIKILPNGTDIPSSHLREDYLVCGGVYYLWNPSNLKYEIIEVHEYCTGVKDVNSNMYVFDYQHFRLLSDMQGYDEWYDSENLEGDKYRFYEELTYLPSVYVSDYVGFNNSIFMWDSVNETYVPVDGETYKVQECTNSKLRDLRVYREYVNPFGMSEEPDINHDWLYYYKIGNISGLVVETDNIGNIINDSEVSNGVCYTLHAYGNIINAITYNENDNTVTFDYVIGAHLTAVYDGTEIDNDGNQRYFYKDFAYDDLSTDGVRFVETYACADDSIRNLNIVTSPNTVTDFELYVNGDIRTLINHAFEKFPFNRATVLTPDNIKNAEGIGVAEFTVENNLLHSNTIREEWLEGIYYQPRIKSDVSIDRGNGSAFERHIRLGEIRTMEDFEYYQNGGYFNVDEN